MPLYGAISLSSLRSRSSRIRPRHRSVPLPKIGAPEPSPAVAALEAIISPKKSRRKLGKLKRLLAPAPKMFSKIFKVRGSPAAPGASARAAAAGSTSPVLPELEPHSANLGTWDFGPDRTQPRTLVVKAFGRNGWSSPSSSDAGGMPCHSEHTRTPSEGSSTLCDVEDPSLNNASTGQAGNSMPNNSTISLTGYIFNPETNKFEAVRMPQVEKERSDCVLISAPTTPRLDSSAEQSKPYQTPRKFPLTDHKTLANIKETIIVAAQSPKHHLRRRPAWQGHHSGLGDSKGVSTVEPSSRFLSPKRVHQVGSAPATQNIASVLDVDRVISLSELLSRAKGPVADERAGGRSVQILL